MQNRYCVLQFCYIFVISGKSDRPPLHGMAQGKWVSSSVRKSVTAKGARLFWWTKLLFLFAQVNRVCVFRKKSTLHCLTSHIGNAVFFFFFFLICSPRSTLVFWGISRTNTARSGSLSLGFLLNNRKKDLFLARGVKFQNFPGEHAPGPPYLA